MIAGDPRAGAAGAQFSSTWGAPGRPTAPSAPNPEDDAGTPRWQLALERAQALAHRAGRALEGAPPSRADLGPAARAVEAAIAALLDAIDRRADRLAAVRAAQAELDRAAAAVEALPEEAGAGAAAAPLREARGALAGAEERFLRALEEPPPVPELRASGELPALHTLPRATLAPALRVPAPVPPPPGADAPPIPKPESVEALEDAIEELKRRAEERRKVARAKLEEATRAAPPEEPAPEPRPGFARGKFVAAAPADVLAGRARECFEEVAMVGSQRAPLLGDPWRSAQILERRLLAAIDAIAALGPQALARLEPMALDAPAKDPARAFAIGMVLGCFAGRDALAAAERVARHHGVADPEIAAAFAGAMKLVPHPALPIAMRTLLADPDPACRALAVEVLAYRGLASPAELAAAALDADPRVAAAALPALGVARAPELDAAAQRAAASDDPALREAAWIAMVLANHPQAATTLDAALDGPLASRAAALLAIAGDDRDAAAILERLRAAPSPALAAAAGWAGAPDAVPALIELLDHKEPAVQLAAAYALDRITGAQLYEEVEVEPDVIAVPDVEEPDVGEPKPQPLARAVSDPRDLPSEGANDTVSRPALQPDRWRALWLEKSADFRPLARYRRGRPYAPLVSLWELDAWPASPAERRMLQRELVVRTGYHVRFDPHDFVVAQEDALRQWEPLAQRAGATPGGWSRPMRR